MSRLYARLTSFENLYASAHEVFRGKRGRAAANALFNDLEGALFALQRALLERSYAPGPYHSFRIVDPKPRLISAAPLLDRVVHHALVRVIEPIFERRFIHHSYACRKGRGTKACFEQFVTWARDSRFVLTVDLEKFFPSVDHEVLKQELRRALWDEDVLWLSDTIIDGSNPQDDCAWYFPGDELYTPFARRRGLPIGNLTSQFFANVLLDRVDHVVKDRLRMRRYVRYVDDLALMHDARAPLLEARVALEETFAAMRLRAHPRKSRLRRVDEGIRFLGFVVRPTSLRLGATAVRRHRRRLRHLRLAVARGEMSFADAKVSLSSHAAHAASGDTWSHLLEVARRNPFRGP